MIDRNKSRRTVGKAVEWLKQRLKPDGSYELSRDDVGIYYKSPYLFGTTGNHKEASTVLDWIKGHLMTGQGDFTGKKRKTGIEVYDLYVQNYMNAWIVMGAQISGRFDISLPGLRFITKETDSSLGGIHLRKGNSSKDKRMDMGTLSCWGLAWLHCNEIEKAIKAGSFLQRLIRMQPCMKEIFYVSITSSNKLAIDYPDEEQIFYSVDAKKDKQMYWYIGIAMGFLGKLYLATGKQKYLATAKDLFTFARRCAEDRTRTFASGKLGWGSAVLYHITGDRKCLSMTEKTANYLIEAQNRNGSWGDSTIPAPLIYDLTAEMALWLAEYDREIVTTRPIASLRS